MSYPEEVKKLFAVLLAGIWMNLVMHATEADLSFLAWLMGSLRHLPGW